MTSIEHEPKALRAKLEAASQAKICQPERWSSNGCSDRSFASSSARWRLGLTVKTFLFPA